ncbi:MAG: sensor histidine kinase [Bacteroidetes bacterium]|nr:MAG: sensor histidine kinase [Bacteroidota bacterium]
MSLSFKNRIAFYYMLATASVTAVVFFVIFFVVKTTVFQELDRELAFEAHKHTKEIQIVKDSILFVNKREWAEREHREVQVNPVFIQVVNNAGQIMDKSPNLKDGHLVFDTSGKVNNYVDGELNNRRIRQVQIPIEEAGRQRGYILTAMSQEGAIIVLNNLRRTLLVLFPIVLVGLFFIARFLAGQSILPVKIITRTANAITRTNLNERIPYPVNKDELFELTAAINELLARIQKAMEREKQFTADASHQLRTPLAVLKGTFEVLNRKPRTPEEYREKIEVGIAEIDRMSEIVNQLLVLARFDEYAQKQNKRPLDLRRIIDDVLSRFKSEIEEKNLTVEVHVNGTQHILADAYYVDLILENILSNAIKYSFSGGKIAIELTQNASHTTCRIKDEGRGINPGDLEQIFQPFFRSEALLHKDIKGNGLGLSIVRKAIDFLGGHIEVDSEPGKGTTCSISFPNS